MAWNNYEIAPRDGTPILIKDQGSFGPFSNSVRYQLYDPDDAEVIGETGYWCYCDELLNDAAPEGPSVPFQWIPDPSAETTE